MTNNRQDSVLGLLFFATLIGLGAMTIVLSDFQFGKTSYQISLLSPDVGFLRPGDPVLVFGMNSGKVLKIDRVDPAIELSDPASGAPVLCTVRVTARVDLDLFTHLRSDQRILIEDRGVLGGKLVRVDAGTAPDLIAPGTPLLARAGPSILQAAGDILEENRAGLRTTIDNLSQITTHAAQGQGPLGMLLNDQGLAQRIDRVVTNLADLSDRLAAGQGTLGHLLSDDEMADSVKGFVDDMHTLSAGLVAGEGTLGKLLRQDDVHDDLLSTLNELRDGVVDAREMLAKLSSGQGTLGKLLTDDSLHAQASALLSDLSSLSADLRAGKGTMGRLFTDSTLYDNANDMITDIRGAVTSITEGDGLLAVLMNDTQLADDFRSIMSQVLGAIEDARETTPVQSLGSFLFGTF